MIFTVQYILFVFICSLFFLSAPLVDNACAAHKSRNRTVIVSHRAVSHGSIHPRLSKGYRTFWVNKAQYFHHAGVFYRRGSSGYVVIPAPVGTVVVSLPIGYRTVWSGGMRYYYYGDVFYRPVPAGYVVVQPPAEVEVVKESPEIIRPSEYVRGEVLVTSYSLNVRTGPGLDFPVIDQVYRDDILEMHGKSNGWLFVKLSNGQFGWVLKIYTFQKYPPASG